jgi:hypothetical protein
MLSIMDPVELDDLVVFRDDEDARKFYVLPDQPAIPNDADGEPEFLFIKYIKDVETTTEEEAPGAGYVQFRTVLTNSAERRERLINSLKARLEEDKAAGKKPLGLEITSTEPLLAAPLWSKGEVALATFKVSDTGLVRHATETAPADLAGDLGASFRLDLDENGSEIFWGAFKDYGEQVPILITYQLNYKARVAAKMTIKAKRDVIQQQLWNYAQPYRLLATNFLRYVPMQHQGVLSASALGSLRMRDQTVAAMIPRRLLPQIMQESMIRNEIEVRIETDQAGGGEEETKVRELMFKVASDVLSDRLIPALFGQGSMPGAGSESDRAATKDLLEVKDLPAGDATFDLTLDHQTTVDRQVNPNGPIQLAVEAPEKLAGCFKELRLSDGFFKQMKVVASTAGVNFERDGIDRIHVWLRYDQVDEQNPAKPHVRHEFDAAITKETETIPFRFDLARLPAGGHKRGYQYRTKVYYRQGPPSPPDDGTWIDASDRTLIITPGVIGAIRVQVALTMKGVESVRVLLEHDAGGKTHKGSLELNPETPVRTWFQYTGAVRSAADASMAPAYRYQAIYRIAGSELSVQWRESTSDLLEIGNPFSRKLSYTLLPKGSFEGISAIAGEVVYNDSPHNYRARFPFKLEKLTDSFAIDIPALEGGPDQANWTARAIHSDGTIRELAPGSGPSGTYTLGGGSAMSVQILADLINFDSDVQLAIVELAYDDPANGIGERKTLTFSKTAKAPVTWIVPRHDAARNKYSAHIRYVAYDRAKSTEVTLQDIDQQVLLLDRAAV